MAFAALLRGSSASMLEIPSHVLTARQVSQSNDQNIGSATQASSNSLSGLLATLIPVALTALGFLVAFFFLRRFERRQYAPRTYIRTIPKHKRTPALPNGWFNWIKPFWSMPDVFVLQNHSLDAYFFLRFLKLSCVLSFVGACLTWPILFPVNATGGAGQKQLDLLSMSNVADNNRLYAHVFLSWIFFGFILYLVTRETVYYVNLRQAYLLSPVYSSRVSQRTVLFASVPPEFLDETKLRSLFGDDVARIWLNSNSKELEKLVKERDKVAYRLEAAETNLIVTAAKNHAKSQKKKGAEANEEVTSGSAGDNASGSVARRYVPDKKRPTHRLKPIIGKKVDTINWSRDHLKELIPQVDLEQDKHHKRQGDLIGSVFIEFKTQEAAQAAAQSVASHLALHMAPRWIGIPPQDVIWSNLRIKWWERKIRETAVLTFIIVLIIFWSLPVAFVGAVSNINYLTEKFSWLAWINKIPSQILGIVTGLLPTILLAVLMSLVPIIMRLVSKLAGAPSRSVVELKTQNYYFAFQVIQGFLVMTFTSAASAAVQQIISQPSSAINLLSSNLPKASNFFINYLILQGLTVSSGAILQIAALVVRRLLGTILDKTPRKVYNRWANLTSLGWGSLYPAFTLLTVIALTYAIIAPLTLGFATIGFALLYIAFRYNFLYTANTVVDTQGLAYSQALNHILIGVYFAEVCLLGLFAVNAAPGPAVLQAIFLVFTILYHIRINSAFSPLKTFLPKDLIVKERQLALVESHGSGEGDHKRDVEVSASSVYPASTAPLDRNGNGSDGMDNKRTADTGLVNRETDLDPTGKTPSLFAKFFRPDRHCDYTTMRRLVPKHHPQIVYTEDDLRSAYMNPAVGSETPLLWIPQDKLGVSDEEVRHTQDSIHITNEHAYLDEKNKIQWNEEVDPPIYEEPKEW